MAKKNIDNNTVKIFAISALVVVIFAVIFGTNILQGDVRTISMDGEYIETVAPDNVEIIFSVTTRAGSAASAQEENTIASDDVISAFKSNGYTDSDIETEYYSVYPEYDWSNDRQEIIGYIATHQIRVNNSDITQAGTIVDTAIDNGATEINYVDFSLKQETEQSLRVSALSKASENAREKAEAVAEGLGLSVIKVVSVSEGNIYYPPYRIAYAEAVDSAGSSKEIQLTPGNVEVSANVMVTFEIA